MQFIYILLPLFYSVGSLASPGPNDKVTQYNCANHIYSEAEVGNFFKAAAVELAKTQMGQPPKMPLLNPYEPKPSSPSLKHEYFSFYAARLKGLKGAVMKFVVINEAQKPVSMAWGINAKYPCDKRIVKTSEVKKPWNSHRQERLWREHLGHLPSNLRR
ncbi:putative secreted effector protein [Blumeria graminis f. sp. tritici 96224]|uniref:Putative secreted effector protein n=1 Tax=Blumeria graminis f. sp. tritici 96224 TaxID=1268274 RepID=A0A656KQ81_BLUGR|nr:putative secreted effector protein [Blumeria graminis f. sp. tritici 96224]